MNDRIGDAPEPDTQRPTSTDAPVGTLTRIGVFGLMLGIFLATLDGQIVSTALPTVVGDLGGLDHLSWVVTAYLLTSAAATPVWGKLGDLYGRKGAYLCSVVLFLVGSVLSGLAQDMGQLIAFRALQGLGAGGLMVGALSVIGVLVPASERGRTQSMIGAMLPVAFVGGPLLGGFLTDHLTWRWAFYVNVPIGIVALLAVGTGVRLHTVRTKARVDYPGVALLTVGILALTLLGSWGGSRYAWASVQVAGLGVLAAVALALFVRVEQRAEEPVTPLRLFRNRDFALAQVLSFLVGAILLAVVNYLPQYMQFVQGASATASGLLLLPLMLGMLAAQLTTGRLMGQGRRDRLFPIFGGAATIAGAFLLLLLGRHTPTAVASALTLVVGGGIGVLMQSTLLTTMNSAPPRDMGAATGSVTLVRTIGGSLGVAVLGAVYVNRMQGVLVERLGERNGGGLAEGGRLTPALLKDMSASVRVAVEEAVTSGLRGVLVGAAALAVLAFGTAWLVRDFPTRTEPAKGEAPPPGPAAGPPPSTLGLRRP